MNSPNYDLDMLINVDKYDKLREKLGNALSNLANEDKEAVFQSLLSACEELNTIEFGPDSPRPALMYHEFVTTSTEGGTSMRLSNTK